MSKANIADNLIMLGLMLTALITSTVGGIGLFYFSFYVVDFSFYYSIITSFLFCSVIAILIMSFAFLYSDFINANKHIDKLKEEIKTLKGEIDFKDYVIRHGKSRS